MTDVTTYLNLALMALAFGFFAGILLGHANINRKKALLIYEIKQIGIDNEYMSSEVIFKRDALKAVEYVYVQR